MRSIIDKVATILPDLEARGTVYIFALAERERGDVWDVILSSEWSDRDWAGSIGVVIDLLWPHLETCEKVQIAGVSVVPSSDLRVHELPNSFRDVRPEDEKVVYATLLGTDIRRAYIYRAQHAPVPAPVAVSVPDVAVHA